MEDKAKLVSLPSTFQANLYEAKLREKNIDFWVLDKLDSSYKTFGEIEFYVMPDKLEEARAALGIS